MVARGRTEARVRRSAVYRFAYAVVFAFGGLGAYMLVVFAVMASGGPLADTVGANVLFVVAGFAVAAHLWFVLRFSPIRPEPRWG